jgi:uncharacterized protein (DUF433 family)
MARYSLNLPADLKTQAEQMAAEQSVSLNQFILWAVAEKVGSLTSQLDDPRFSQIAYRRGASGRPVPVVRGTGIRVQAVVIAAQDWQLSPQQIADEYGLSKTQVKQALSFYQAHKQEVDALIAADQMPEQVDA